MGKRLVSSGDQLREYYRQEASCAGSGRRAQRLVAPQLTKADRASRLRIAVESSLGARSAARAADRTEERRGPWPRLRDPYKTKLLGWLRAQHANVQQPRGCLRSVGALGTTLSSQPWCWRTPPTFQLRGAPTQVAGLQACLCRAVERQGARGRPNRQIGSSRAGTPKLPRGAAKRRGGSGSPRAGGMRAETEGVTEEGAKRGREVVQAGGEALNQTRCGGEALGEAGPKQYERGWQRAAVLSAGCIP